MTATIADLDLMIAQYETRIAFEIAHPFTGQPQSVPYCFIPDRIKSRIEDGRADFLKEIKKLHAAAVAARQAVR